jgi:putative dehydrogenase
MATPPSAVGLIGLGIMGTALSHNLLQAGFPVVGFDVDPSRVDALIRDGGRGARHAADVARQCEAVIASLPSSAALHATVSGAGGLLSAPRPGLIVSECSTLPLVDKQAAHAALAAAGMTLLDSPLSGTGAQAVHKDLLVFCSGDRAAYDRFLPIYRGISRGSHHLGAFGNGSRLKFIANLLVAIHNVAAAEALVLAKKSGLDAWAAHKILCDSAGTSRMFEVRGPSMVAGKYEPAMMKLELWKKDLSIIADFAAELHCPAPLFALCAQFYEAALAQGRAAEDTAAVCAVLEALAGVERS